MWPHWSRLLEVLGPIGFGAGRRISLTVGDPSAPDARGGDEWQQFLGSEALYRVWGPLEGSPWAPFHAVPLFAALDRLSPERVGPTSPDAVAPEILPEVDPGIAAGSGVPGDASGPGRPRVLPPHARPGAPPPSWLDSSSWIILDLPGPLVVEAAVWLVAGAGVQPVCTFDHWPHPAGVLKPERILAELLRWSTTMAAVRGRISGDAPPLWICDSERLGSHPGAPGLFDNRYYLDDSILPGPGFLARAGIGRVVYLAWDDADIPTLDLEECFSDLLALGFPVHCALIADPSLELRPFAAPPVRRRVDPSTFRRSAAGGFGTDVPEPSSGGSG